MTALATTTFADVTGILAAGALAVVGLFVVPVRRRQAKAAMRERIETMRRQLMESLTQPVRCAKWSEASIAFATRSRPYSRFVRAEHERLAAAESQLTVLHAGLHGLQRRVEALATSSQR